MCMVLFVDGSGLALHSTIGVFKAGNCSLEEVCRGIIYGMPRDGEGVGIFVHIQYFIVMELGVSALPSTFASVCEYRVGLVA